MCDKQLLHWDAALPAILHIWLWGRGSTSTNVNVALKGMFHIVHRSKTQLPFFLPLIGTYEWQERCGRLQKSYSCQQKISPFCKLGLLGGRRTGVPKSYVFSSTSFPCHSYISKGSEQEGCMSVRAFLLKGKWP